VFTQRILIDFLRFQGSKALERNYRLDCFWFQKCDSTNVLEFWISVLAQIGMIDQKQPRFDFINLN